MHSKWVAIEETVRLSYQFRQLFLKNSKNSILNPYLTWKPRVEILVIDQFNAQILVYNKFITFLYMFRALCGHNQEVKIVIIQHLVSSHSLGGRPVHLCITEMQGQQIKKSRQFLKKKKPYVHQSPGESCE